ncbi:hypothetical protein EGJ58_07185 [Brucella anthropi]|nr:hypothetical protein EGJ58_07185 [Brucella anthropi]
MLRLTEAILFSVRPSSAWVHRTAAQQTRYPVQVNSNNLIRHGIGLDHLGVRTNVYQCSMNATAEAIVDTNARASLLDSAKADDMEPKVGHKYEVASRCLDYPSKFDFYLVRQVQCSVNFVRFSAEELN